ncbi:E4 [Gammapapillomavirus 9]|uniref:E4 protein n=1 Tax=Human papillomavirus TaxID=10566 RepID=A0A451G3F2_9PAPI|nr:E4 [Gammapapillomavirus 9]QAB13931.1 MAG: E4 protein [Human papillomavirus]
MLKMNNCPFQPTARLGGLRVVSPSLPPPSVTSLRQPPGTPRPPRPTDEERNKHRRKVLGLPHDHLDDDDDEEKENKPPIKEEEEEEEEDVRREDSAVYLLLTKWDKAIDQLIQQICRDLKLFKQKLGIPTSS